MVAHKGITKSAILFLIPFVLVRSKVTGIVAADDIVPSAVKYAGSIFFNIANGFFLISEPATVYCTSNQTQCMIIATSSTTDRKSTRLNSSHVSISYAVFCLKKK